MSESEHIAAAPPKDSFPDSPPNPVMDEEDRLRPGFVEKVLDAVEAGDDETARELVAPLHPADVADLIELARRDERDGLVKALAGIVSPDVLAEILEVRVVSSRGRDNPRAVKRKMSKFPTRSRAQRTRPRRPQVCVTIAN